MDAATRADNFILEMLHCLHIVLSYVLLRSDDYERFHDLFKQSSRRIGVHAEFELAL